MLDPHDPDVRRVLSRAYRQAADDIRDNLAKSKGEFPPAWFKGGEAAAAYLRLQRAFEIGRDAEIGWAFHD